MKTNLIMINITINNNENWEKLVSENPNSLIIMFFHATWCGPCRVLTKTIENMKGEYDDVMIAHVDVEDSDTMAMKFSIRSVPTLLFTKNGYILDRTTGAIGSHAIREKINDCLKK